MVGSWRAWLGLQDMPGCQFGHPVVQGRRPLSYFWIRCHCLIFVDFLQYFFNWLMGPNSYGCFPFKHMVNWCSPQYNALFAHHHQILSWGGRGSSWVFRSHVKQHAASRTHRLAVACLKIVCFSCVSIVIYHCHRIIFRNKKCIHLWNCFNFDIFPNLKMSEASTAKDGALPFDFANGFFLPT